MAFQPMGYQDSGYPGTVAERVEGSWRSDIPMAVAAALITFDAGFMFLTGLAILGVLGAIIGIVAAVIAVVKWRGRHKAVFPEPNVLTKGDFVWLVVVGLVTGLVLLLAYLVF